MSFFSGVLTVLSLSETPNSAQGTLSRLITLKPHDINCPNYSRALSPDPRGTRSGGAAPGTGREPQRVNTRRPGGRVPNSAARGAGRVCGPPRAHLSNSTAQGLGLGLHRASSASRVWIPGAAGVLVTRQACYSTPCLPTAGSLDPLLHFMFL